MATPGTQPVREAERSAFSFEKAAKMGTFALPGIYVCGFVVISLYEADFGIRDFTLVRVKALAAGLVFALFLAIPALAGIRSFRLLGLRNPGGTRVDLKNDSQKTYLYVVKTLEFYFYCPFLSLIFGAFFWQPWRNWIVNTPAQQQPGHFSWLFLCAGLISMLTLALPAVQARPVSKAFADKPVRCLVLTCLTFALWVTWTLRMSDWLFFQLSAWFYLVGLSAVGLSTAISKGVGFKSLDWELRLLIGLSFALSWFSTSMYGNMKPAYGGGHPIPATLYLQQADPVLGSKMVDTSIIEETEQGYYVAAPSGKSKAVFIPRSLITSVRLGDTTSPK